MTASNADTTATADREIVTSRVFDAPRERVFEAWMRPEHVARWFGPTGFTITTHEMDVRPGGVWHFVMHGPDGVDYPNHIVYIEVEPPERLVYDHGEDAGHAGSGDFRTTVTFTEEDGKTRLTMRAVFATAEAREHVVREFGAIEGGQQTLGRLGEYLDAM